MYQYQVSFSEAARRALTTNYCNFSGRASRSEFWWFQLFSFIVGCILSILLFATDQSTFWTIVYYAVAVYFILPSFGLVFRRLHDTGRSGWWWLLSFIPLVGEIILIVWFCQDSQPFENRFGRVPNQA